MAEKTIRITSPKLNDGEPNQKSPGAKGISRRSVLAAGAAAVLVRKPIRTPHRTALMQWADEKGPDYGISADAIRKARRRAAELVSKMTVAEKISQLGYLAPAIPRIGLPAYDYYSGEALHGLVTGPPVTAFPLPLALANAWNPDLQYRIYTAVSDEARGYHKKYNRGLAYYSPQTLNMARDPRWGRIEETLGEDPLLVSTLAVQVIRGIQGPSKKYLKMTACIKHFICNGTDDDRHYISETVDPRSFWEYYTRAFEACVREGKSFTLMSSYNAVNGIPNSCNRTLLTDILRRRWGFRGYVVSDCDAVADICRAHHFVPTFHEAAALALNAGCDSNCGNTYQKYTAKALADELVSLDTIDRAVARVLTGRFLFGEFDPPDACPYNKIGFDVVASPAHAALALEAARESIVLLKNDGILPLDKNKAKRIAVIGPMALQAHLGGYSGNPAHRVSPLQGIANALGVQASSGPGIRASDFVGASPNVQTQSCSEGGLNVCWLNNGSWLELPITDITGKTALLARVASAGPGGRLEVHLDSRHGPVIAHFDVKNTGGWQKWVTLHSQLKTVSGKHKLFLTFSGDGKALFNLEWIEFTPVVHQHRGMPPVAVIYEPGCGVLGAADTKQFERAVHAAKEADVAILVLGADESVDAEQEDRDYIHLPGAQHELAKAVFAANPKTILVVSSNCPVAVNWENDNLPAIVGAIFAGQAQGTAIADVLFGHYNPAGKTAVTWYRDTGELPLFHDFNITNRTYMYFNWKVLYPFGYGLSYTTWHYSNLKLSSHRLTASRSMKISLDVANTGSVDGDEIVQCYITPPQVSGIKRPIKQLVAFKRVHIPAGKKMKVEFDLPRTQQAFYYWDESRREFVSPPGTFSVFVGKSSADDKLRLSAELV